MPTSLRRNGRWCRCGRCADVVSRDASPVMAGAQPSAAYAAAAAEADADGGCARGTWA